MVSLKKWGEGSYYHQIYIHYWLDLVYFVTPYLALQICSLYIMFDAIKTGWKAFYIKLKIIFMIYDKVKFIERVNIMLCDTLEIFFSCNNHLLIKFVLTYVVKKFITMTSSSFNTPAFLNNFAGLITSSESVNCRKKFTYIWN